jgi:charged multivesicular body protein 3
MNQSGIIEEMMDDTMETLDDDELEDEADAEVEKVLFDLTDGKLGQAGAVGADLPVSPRSNLMLLNRGAEYGLPAL